jgi:hypothetical protein
MKNLHLEKIMRKFKSISFYIATILFISTLFSGCASTAFNDAKKVNSVKAYNAFLKEYPTSKFANETKARILNVKLSKNNLNKKVYVKNDYNDFKKSEYITILDIKNGIAIASKGDIKISNVENKRSEFKLIVKSLKDSKINIVNSTSKYNNGIWLKKGSYEVEVSKNGYYSKKDKIIIDNDKTINIELKKIPFFINGNLSWKNNSIKIDDKTMGFYFDRKIDLTDKDIKIIDGIVYQDIKN